MCIVRCSDCVDSGNECACDGGCNAVMHVT